MLKFVFGLVMVVGFGHQALACGGSALDCRIGNDKVGGKFCHYQVSACESASCDEAIKCTVEKWSRFTVSMAPASSVKVEFSKSKPELGEGVQLHKVSSKVAGCKASSCENDHIVLTETSSSGMCSVLSIQ
jgi:hypothetical protein